MVNRSNAQEDPDKVTPNNTLQSEWDLLAEIWNAHCDLGDRDGLTWVKGHRDDKKKCEDLSLPAQLNVDADELANQFIVDNPDLPYHQVPLLPTSGIQLNFSNGTVTHKLKRAIRWAKTEGPLKEHLCNKFDWSEATFDDINWEAFRVAMNRLEKNRVTLSKHACDWIRVGTRVNRDNPKYPRNCPSCLAEEETAPHLITCPSRNEWRNKCKQALRKFFQKWDTPIDVQELLLEGVA